MNAPTVVPSQFQTALLTLGLTVVAALQAALLGGLTLTEGLQLLALLVGGIVTYFSPLLGGKWAAGLKVSGAVLGAVLVAVISVLDSAVNGGVVWNAETITFIFFAGLNALAAQYGVDRRVADTKAALADPEIPNSVVQAKDPGAVHTVILGG